MRHLISINGLEQPQCTNLMETWSISYTADKHKAKNRCWLQGKMNYNASTSQAHFYDEDGAEIGKMKLKAEQVEGDVELSLWKHLIEIGVKEEVGEAIEDVFDRLNKELGIDEFDKKFHGGNSSKKVKIEDATKQRAPVVIKQKTATLTKPDEPFTLYDILYTRSASQKKTKVWHDGFMKLFDELKVAEFYGEDGKLMCKKVFSADGAGDCTVKEGMIVEGAGGGLVIEICALRSGDKSKEADSTVIKQLNSNNQVKTATNNKTSINTAHTDTTCTNVRLFNILYTTDKHKKAKKWLDARLEYNLTTNLARFIDEESENCFFKKIMKAEEVKVGKEFSTGVYLMQIDNEIVENKENLKSVVCNPVKSVNEVKKKNIVSSVVANGNVPNEGRSNEELLSLLRGNQE